MKISDHFYVILEKPCIFTKELVDTEVTEGKDVILHCETSKSDSPVKWCKDGKSLRNSSKYNISRSGFEAKLVIYGAEERDSGRYECEAGAAKSSAVITVKGKNVWSNGLSSTLSSTTKFRTMHRTDENVKLHRKGASCLCSSVRERFY